MQIKPGPDGLDCLPSFDVEDPHKPTSSCQLTSDTIITQSAQCKQTSAI